MIIYCFFWMCMIFASIIQLCNTKHGNRESTKLVRRALPYEVKVKDPFGSVLEMILFWIWNENENVLKMTFWYFLKFCLIVFLEKWIWVQEKVKLCLGMFLKIFVESISFRKWKWKQENDFISFWNSLTKNENNFLFLFLFSFSNFVLNKRYFRTISKAVLLETVRFLYKMFWKQYHIQGLN